MTTTLILRSWQHAIVRVVQGPSSPFEGPHNPLRKLLLSKRPHPEKTEVTYHARMTFTSTMIV